MSSDSEMSEFSDMTGNPEDEDVEEGKDEDYDVIYSEIQYAISIRTSRSMKLVSPVVYFAR